MARMALGIDVGTTGVKGVLIGSGGELVAEALAPHDLHSPYPGWAEEDPADWWQGVISVCRQLLAGRDPKEIAVVGCSGMVPALVLLDETGAILRPAILQNDARAVAEIEWLRQNLDQELLFSRTGGYTNQQHVGPRLMWIQRHEPEVWHRTRRVMGSYDYIAYRLTGTWSLEINWAVESGLFDIHQQAWDATLLAASGLWEELFPSVHSPTDIIGVITKEAAEATGLAPGTPVVAGSADHVASALAAGLRENGDLLIKFGAAGDILYCMDCLEPHPQLYIDYHDIPGRYLLNGCMAASGSLVKWFVTQVLGEPGGSEVYRRLDEEAAQTPPAADGLIVLPYFLGEKTPLFDPQARGIFFGLTLSHGRGHMFRAILEAVIYGFQHHVEILKEQGYPIRRVLATDGGVRSRLWRQIAADVLGMPVESHPAHPGSALGVAFVAGMGIGLFSDWAEIEAFTGPAFWNEPDPKAYERYQEAYRLYRDLYEALKALFPRAARLSPHE
ncbi:MAG TPA: FGGY-family carbohydrate kinase [Thermoflexus sp.]|nr:FGGY-family carbohydrate kinase [Thermoflexus sp.]